MGLLNFIKRLLQKPKTKEEIIAVNNVSFSIKKGELFGLLGPNGAGKTTLVKTLCTLLWPNAGTAKVNGYDIRKEPKKVRASIGTVLDVRMGWYGRLVGRTCFFTPSFTEYPLHVSLKGFRRLWNLLGSRRKRMSGNRSSQAVCKGNWIWHGPSSLILQYCFSTSPPYSWTPRRPEIYAEPSRRIFVVGKGKRFCGQPTI